MDARPPEELKVEGEDRLKKRARRSEK